ncbi:hypothetical protein ACOSQ2_022127 [Xanthoceras sorbifolium]
MVDKAFSNLEKVTISRNHIKMVWQSLFSVHLFPKLQFLEILEVESCRSLIVLMPPSACFENLKILKVAHCNRLLSLVAASTTKSLVRLEQMSIQYCQEMKEIIVNEGDVMEGEIVFWSLKSLKLEGLTNLTSFCSGSYTFNFALLKKLTTERCPKMKLFSSGVLSTPNLQQISQDFTNYDCERPNLNTIVKQHYEKKIFSILEQSSLCG